MGQMSLIPRLLHISVYIRLLTAVTVFQGYYTFQCTLDSYRCDNVYIWVKCHSFQDYYTFHSTLDSYSSVDYYTFQCTFMPLNKKPLNVVLNQNRCFTKIKAIPLNDTKFKFCIAVAKTWIRTYT